MHKLKQVSLADANWASIAGNWSQKGSIFAHNPGGLSSPFSLYVCDKRIRDGAIEGTVRVFTESNDPGTGRLVFRYGPEGCYYAGLGGYGRHFAIVKQIRGQDGISSFGLATDGQALDIRYGEPYHFRVEFIGDKITLKCSGVTVLEATDSWFQDGHIGFDTYGQTHVEFFNFCAYETPPITDLIRVLESFPYTLKRDYRYLKRELKDESDVQRILWTILRSHFSDLVDEEVLGRFGLKHYKDDFGIPSLSTIVEVKVIKESTNLKNLQEQLMVDSIGYLKSETIYQHLVFFIYNKANKPIDTALIEALESLDDVAAVIIIPGVKSNE